MHARDHFVILKRRRLSTRRSFTRRLVDEGSYKMHSDAQRLRSHASPINYIAIFTIFAVRPSSSLTQLPMSAFSSALPIGEIQLTASRPKSTSSTRTMVNVSVAPILLLRTPSLPCIGALSPAKAHRESRPPVYECATQIWSLFCLSRSSYGSLSSASAEVVVESTDDTTG